MSRRSLGCWDGQRSMYMRIVLKDNSKRYRIIPSPKNSAKEISERDENVIANPNPLPTTSIQGDASTPDPAPTRMQKFWAFKRSACAKLFGLVYAFIGFPLKRFLGALDDMLDCTTVGDERLRVPTFYAAYNVNDHYDFIPFAPVMCVATVFGAIHCIAWSFHFATLQERWVWRISAILVSGLPISLVASQFLFATFTDKYNKPTWMKLCEIFIALWWYSFISLHG